CGDLHAGIAGRDAGSEIGAIAAGRMTRALNIAKGIAPDTNREIDVFLPEALIRVGDGAVRLGVIVGRGRHVAGDLVVIEDTTGPQLGRERVRASVLDPVQDGFVVNDIVTRGII